MAESDHRHETPAVDVASGDAAGIVTALQDVGRLFYDRGWSVGTSSNYSALLDRDPFRLLITASGRDKRDLQRGDFVVVDDAGRLTHSSPGQPSAETLLHVVAARRPGVGAVLHTHSVWATVLSERFAGTGAVEISGYEMLKGLAGISTHHSTCRLEIFENTQDIPALADRLQQRLDHPDRPLRHGFLIRGHGLYTWGADLAEARRHVEILEFLLEVVGRQSPDSVP